MRFLVSSKVASGMLAIALVASSFQASTVYAAGPARAACGGTAGLGCGAGMFCETPLAACRSAAIAGRCEAVPLACPRIILPVCGCNGRTYANDCERRAAKVYKAHDGACS